MPRTVSAISRVNVKSAHAAFPKNGEPRMPAHASFSQGTPDIRYDVSIHHVPSHSTENGSNGLNNDFRTTRT